jgi:inositol phosphorylceramide mannosyltransferase catalytic subunit
MNKQIHFSWKTKKIPKKFQNWVNTWNLYNPEWNIKLWTDDDNENFIRQHYDYFLDTYLNYSSNIERADSMRYFYLYHFGGLYVDLDFECLRNIEPLLNSDIVLGQISARRYKKNIIQEVHPSFLYCETPKHDFFGEIVNDGLQTAFQKYKDIDRTKRGFGCIEVWTTGIEFLRQKVIAGNDKYDIKVVEDEIYPYHHKELSEFSNVKNFGERFPKSFAVHHWASSYRN